jgi:hypothetical protein
VETLDLEFIRDTTEAVAGFLERHLTDWWNRVNKNLRSYNNPDIKKRVRSMKNILTRWVVKYF